MELKQFFYDRSFYADPLLIVPYGIETCNHFYSTCLILTFNRTLWN